jgi:O-antigen/teichoic acid export membrane protein
VKPETESPQKDNTGGTGPPVVAAHESVTDRLHRLLRLLSAFLFGQGAVQAVGVLAGLYLVRKLSIEAYAQFGLAWGFQATVSTLMDFGLASTIIPLVAERIHDRGLVGRYVRAAKHLRDQSFWLMSPFVAAAFVLITYRHHWSWTTQIFLLLSVLIALYSSGKVSYFSAPLFLYRRFRSYYVPQTFAGLGRLVAYIVMGALGWLNASCAALLSALNVTTNGWLIGRESRKYFEWPDQNDSAAEKEVFHYILPATPAILLGAFHGQISLFLISIFGATKGIADVAALGRLGQLFAVLMTFNIVVVEPYVARLHRKRLSATYFKLLGCALAAAASLSLFAFAEPGVFLWLLGPKYQDLRSLIGWVVVTACINYIAGLMWIMNRSRKWVFWRGSVLELALVFLVQIGFLILVGVRTTREAVFFNFASSFCYIITHGYIALYGHSIGPPLEANAANNDIGSFD